MKLFPNNPKFVFTFTNEGILRNILSHVSTAKAKAHKTSYHYRQFKVISGNGAFWRF